MSDVDQQLIGAFIGAVLIGSVVVNVFLANRRRKREEKEWDAAQRRLDDEGEAGWWGE